MLLRNGKRKLAFSEDTQPTKKQKQQEQPRKIYVNDDNSHPLEFETLWNVGPIKAQKMISERVVNGNYTSELDLVSRISGVTRKTFLNSDVQVMFTSRRETAELEIYETLLQTKMIKDLFASNEKEILKIIAKHSIGKVTECDNPNCSGRIVMLNHSEIYNRTECHSLQNKNCYVFREYDEKHWYYFRDNSVIGKAVFCGNCYLQLRNCINCFQGVYFENDESSYVVCQEQHFVQEEESTELHPFTFKSCLSCGDCFEHVEHEDTVTHFACHLDCFFDGESC